MKKIGLLTREKIVEELKEKVANTDGLFFISFNKVKAFPLNVLRNNLKDSQASIFVTKNSLFKKALSELGWEGIDELVDTETGIVFVGDEDVVKPCKILVEFAKESETLQIKGGVINDKKVTSKEVVALAKLPSKEVLLGMAVSAIASPLSGFVNSLNQIILKFVWTISEVKEAKEKK
jgi:large subunit ribosomal protein L10